jgi:hypothetical protein
MKPDLAQIERQLASLADDELLKVLDTGTPDYTQSALDIANREADRRGGIEQIRRRVAEWEAEQCARTRDEAAARAETRRYYTFAQHVYGTGRRWILFYGGFGLMYAVFYAVFRSQQLNISGALGIVILAALFALQTIAWSAVTYRRAVEDRRVIFCRACKKALVVNLPAIREMVARGDTAAPCPDCGVAQTLDGKTLPFLAPPTDDSV